MKFNSFAEFYPFYLSQHANGMCRKMHFIGTTFVILTVLTVFAVGDLSLLIMIPVFGYGFAWIGHFGFEKNRPATFKNPIYSLIGDFAMYADIVRGKIPMNPKTN